MHVRRARARDDTCFFSFRYNVVWLKRIRFSEILLGDLPLGAVAPLTNAEREVCPILTLSLPSLFCQVEHLECAIETGREGKGERVG
jgi:hypothetical protein